MNGLLSAGGRIVARAMLLAALAALVTASGAQATTYPTDFEERALVGGLTLPTAVAWTPDGRTLVIEKSGLLKVAAPGSTTATTVLDIRNKVNSYWDRGLLGLAVDSSFTANRYVYLLYTYELAPSKPDQGGKMVSRLTRIQLNADNSVTPETVLLGSYASGPCPAPSDTVDCIPSEGLSHSIGTVRSAPDGSLYVGSGDAASFSTVDPLAFRTYDERSMAGKILRIDRSGRGLTGHPFCPSQTDLKRVCTKLYAKGFRNPFRFTLRPTGGLVVGDVGWNTREEVELIRTGGRSYGWPCYEGKIRTPGYADRSECAAQYAKEGAADANLPPVYDYPHLGSSAVVGGPTYTGTGYPAGYRNTIFYGDYSTGLLKRLEVDDQDRVTAVRDFATDWPGVDLTTTPQGDVAYVSVGYGGPGEGSVQRIAYAASNRDPVARASATPSSGPAPLTVAFDASASSDPDGDTLSFTWDFGDGTSGTGAKPSHTYSAAGSYTARVTVADGRGRTSSTTVAISVGNTRPTPTIESPVDGSKFRVGSTITLRGSATDAEDGVLPASAYSWEVTLHHADHTHPVSQPRGVTQATFTTTTDHDADSYYEITLRVTDSTGLTGTATSIIRPETVSFGIQSSPTGAPVTYSGSSLTTPFTTTSAIGFRTTVTAAERFTKGGRSYAFDRWSDGGARVHDITIPATASTLTVTYRDAGPSGPVAALAFDEGGGTTTRDASGLGNDGALRGATWTSAGRYGAALSFDGVDDWVTVADSASLDVEGPLTVEAWVKLRTREPWDTIILKEGAGNLAYGLYATSSDDYLSPNGVVGSSEVYGNASLALNAWKHVAVSYDGSSARLYLDGALVGTKSNLVAPPATAGALRIGGNSVAGNEFLDGWLDELRIYDRALSASEIATDMSTRIGAAPPDATPPTVSISAPAQGATVSGRTAVRADATDDVGVQSVQFRLDGADLGAADTTELYEVSWDTTTASNGTHRLTAIARDASGKTTTSAERQVTVSNAAGPAPVAAFGFDEGSGASVRDSSGRGNTGSISGASWTTAGKYGAALSFDGVNDWVTVPDSDSLDMTTDYTLGAWVKPRVLTSWDTLILKEAPGYLTYGLYATGGSLRPFGWVGFDVIGASQLPADAWSHVALTYDGAQARLYVNGTLVAANTGAAAVPASADPLRIGGNSGAADEFLNGVVDEVKLYDRALTAAQVAADMQAPTP